MRKFVLIILTLLLVSACGSIENLEKVSLYSDESLITSLSRENGKYGSWTHENIVDDFDGNQTKSYVFNESKNSKLLVWTHASQDVQISINLPTFICYTGGVGDDGSSFLVQTKFLPENKKEFYRFATTRNRSQIDLAVGGLIAMKTLSLMRLQFIEKLESQKTLIMRIDDGCKIIDVKFDIDGSPHIVLKSTE